MKFSELNLNGPLLKALADLGFSDPTTIQHKVFSPIMSGRDVLGIAQTGTGKTFAYLLPLLRQWQYVEKKVPAILIVVPTRELVAQVVEEIGKLTKYTNIKVTGAYGGTNIKTQIQAIVAGVDAIVATPGRLLDLMYNHTIRTKFIKKLVIDEVDEMLNLGFRTQLKNIIDLLPEKRQSLMFTATMTEEVEQFIAANFIDPLKVEAAPTGTPLKNITQVGYKVPNFNTKINFLEHLLTTDKKMSKVLIFSASKSLADEINRRMEERFPEQLAVIHSNKTQNTRFKTVEQFESGACSILIATDIVARGLDVTAVSHVINMDVPAVAENYMHRIGRTGRAGKKGIAITFITPSDLERKAKVEQLMGRKIKMNSMPEEVEVSTVLIDEEIPKIHMKPIGKPIKKAGGEAFHEKSEKNKKADIKVSHFDLMKKRFGTKHPDEYRNKNKSRKRHR